jgi:hypothetical protein
MEGKQVTNMEIAGSRKASTLGASETRLGGCVGTMEKEIPKVGLCASASYRFEARAMNRSHFPMLFLRLS